MRYVKFETIETQRLILRDIRMEDLLEYYERLFGDGDVCRYLLFDPHQDISESMASIEKTLARYAAAGFRYFQILHNALSVSPILCLDSCSSSQILFSIPPA